MIGQEAGLVRRCLAGDEKAYRELIEMYQALTPADDLEFRYGINSPTVRVEGLTVAGH